MATSTFGSNATSSLTALLSSGAMAAADVATIALLIKNDLINGLPIAPGAFSQGNLLYVPNRGILKVLPGDWVAVDTQGWPILVSANSVLNGPWTHVP